MSTWTDEKNTKTLQLYADLLKLGFSPERSYNTRDPEYIDIKIGSVKISYTYDDRINFYSVNTYKYIDNATQRQVSERMTAPNNVKVLSKNKVQAWIDYINARDIELKKISDERVQRVAEYMESVRNLNITWNTRTRLYGSDSDKRGTLEKNGINYTVTISNDSGYISEKIELDYRVRSNISNFIALSNNNYTQE